MNISNNLFSEEQKKNFLNLTQEEQQAALEILTQIQTSGFSERYCSLRMQDYKEQPVDIITFIKDYNYLGAAWHLPNGKCKLFPYWEKRLLELFPDPYTTNYNNAIFSGARGLGKSEIAVSIGLYLMHRLMCLKNPYEYLNLKPTEQVAFAFMNITKELAMDIGINKFQNTVKLSPWFLDRGTITGRDQLVWNPPNFIKIIIGSQPGHVIGQAIYFAFFDEISFIRNQDIEKQKMIAINMIDTAIGGMKTRFIHKGKNPTLLVLASSKVSEKSFLETHTKKQIENDGANLLLVDEAVWNVHPPEDYCGKKFYVAQGNRFLASEIIPDEADTRVYLEKGYKILEVPTEFRSDFLNDIDRALCDFAGVSSSDITKYISGARLQAVKHEELKNAFIQDIIEVGNAPDDKVQYSDFFDLSRIDSKMKSKPLYIHLDMSVSGDKTGIAGVWIASKRASSANDNSGELFLQPAFSVSVKAPKGWQISFKKNRQFIYWLSLHGFNIKGISSDTYQNADLAQELQSKKYNYSTLSVDRVDPVDKICKPYHYFKSLIYEERILLYADCELLTTEILGLEKNSSGKIDHPDGGRSGSKDQSDAVCGACYNASLHSAEFEFDFGESLSPILNINARNQYLEEAEINKAFEKELINLGDPLSSTIQQVRKEEEAQQEHYLDFGFGASRPYTSSNYLAQGIAIW